MNYVKAPTLNHAWWTQLHEVMHKGRETMPRGHLTRELPSKQLVFDMNYPVVTHPKRMLGYKFMAAEAWWILAGRDDVASIEPYSREISKFSDDGHKFFGAYGPPIVEQLPYVIDALKKDPDTRQALLTTWRPSPPVTKDVPCTVAMDFLLRDGHLEMHVFMRSSDNWLGVPYDAFNFTMVAMTVLGHINSDRLMYELPILQPGNLYLTAASSHLYERNWDDVRSVMNLHPGIPRQPLPAFLYDGFVPDTPVGFLYALKDSKRGDVHRWWES